MTHKRKVDVSQYKVNLEMSKTHRVAHFLDWAATNMPSQYHQYNVIVRVINGYRHTPKIGSKEVEQIRNCMSRVQKILRSEYNRGYHSMPSVGVRATTDSADVIRNDLTRKANRLINAKRAVDETAAIVDVSSLPNTEDGKRLSSYFREVTNASKLLSNDRISKLLPPAPPSST